MFGRISNTWGLMGDSWRILKQDKELLLFTLLSGICCIIVIASFAIPMITSDSWMPPEAGEEEEYANRLIEILEPLPTAVLVHNSGPFKGQLL